MHKKPFLALSRMTLIMGLALSSLGAAHAADIASATASVSGLRYRLIDLDLNDGIAPSVSFGGNLAASGTSSVKYDSDGFIVIGYPNENPEVTAPWFSSAGDVFFNTAAPGASASIGSNNSSASSVISAQSLSASLISSRSDFEYAITGYDPVLNDGILRNGIYTNSQGNDAISHTAGAGVEARRALTNTFIDEFGNISGDEVPNITLSANTLLVIEGSLSVQVKADSQAFRDVVATSFPTVTDGLESLYAQGGYVETLASLYLDGTDDTFGTVLPGGSNLVSVTSSRVSLFQGLNVNLGGINDPITGELFDAGTYGDSKTFALTFANASNTDMQAYLGLNLGTYAQASVARSYTIDKTTYGDPVPDAPVLPPVPSIPEPSTYALMGLGLVGILLARRRQRA